MLGISNGWMRSTGHHSGGNRSRRLLLANRRLQERDYEEDEYRIPHRFVGARSDIAGTGSSTCRI
jgi:hypothetical protein